PGYLLKLAETSSVPPLHHHCLPSPPVVVLFVKPPRFPCSPILPSCCAPSSRSWSHPSSPVLGANSPGASASALEKFRALPASGSRRLLSFRALVRDSRATASRPRCWTCPRRPGSNAACWRSRLLI